MILFDIVPGSLHRSPCSSVAALFSRWRRAAVRSLTRPRNTRARRQKSKPVGKKSSRAGCSATSKEVTVDLSSRSDAIRSRRPGDTGPGIGRPIAYPWFYQEFASHGTRGKENSIVHRRHLEATSPIIPLRKYRETDCCHPAQASRRKELDNMYCSIKKKVWRWTHAQRSCTVNNLRSAKIAGNTMQKRKLFFAHVAFILQDVSAEKQNRWKKQRRKWWFA